MKKNLLTAIAVMVTALFVATTIAQASDIKLGGEFWTRYEMQEQHDFNADTEADDFVQSRIRLNADVDINDSVSAFISIQSNKTWGENPGTTGGSAIHPAGDGNTSFTANNQDASVGINEAYFTIKNFATLPVDLKVGTQQIILDGWRLFGNTIWTMGQQTHDATMLTHKQGNLTMKYAWVIAAEDGAPTGANADDSNDIDSHLVWANYQGILGGNLSLYYNYLGDRCGSSSSNASNCTGRDNDTHTFGFRQAGQLYGIDYRGEYYRQWGDATAVANNNIGAGTAANDVDRDAYMFGLRVGKSFNNVTMKPNLTLWYDYYSGTSDEDGRGGEYGGFNTLFDTGHKFLGLMDLYLGQGFNSATGGTRGLGIQDYAIKTKLNPIPGWTLKAHYHWFYTAEGISANSQQAGGGQAVGASNSLGNELDLILLHKLNANTLMNIGYSQYTTSEGLRAIRTNVGSDSSDWAYVQFQVTF
ncbi:MAG: hypothetical protein F3741_08290 [Nitrospinae bacterium]|nr:hypothetical protein [Nitrospinota bacterium]